MIKIDRFDYDTSEKFNIAIKKFDEIYHDTPLRDFADYKSKFAEVVSLLREAHEFIDRWVETYQNAVWNDQLRKDFYADYAKYNMYGMGGDMNVSNYKMEAAWGWVNSLVGVVESKSLKEFHFNLNQAASGSEDVYYHLHMDLK